MNPSSGWSRRQTLALGISALAAAAPIRRARAATSLRFWVAHTSTPETSAAMKGIVAKFEAEHPDIKVAYQPVSGALVYPKFLTAVEGDALPDLADGYTYHPLQFAAMGQVLELDDVMAEQRKDGFAATIVNEYAYKKNFWHGHTWGMPWNLDVRAIYYRKDLLDKAGLPPPTTWDGLVEATLKTNDPKSGVFGFVYPAGDFHVAQHFFMMFMLQAGGSILDKDGNLAFGTTSKDANVRALTYLTDFTLKHKVTPPGVASYDTDDPHTLFIQGRAAFATGTGGVIARLLRENPQMIDRVGVLDTLQGPVAKLTVGFFNSMFAWKHTQNPDATKTLLRWLIEPGQLQPLYRAFPGQLWPIQKAEFNADVFKSIPLMPDMLAKVVPYTTDFAYPASGRPEMGAIDGEKMFAAPVNQVVVGARTPEQAVMDAHAKMAKLFT